MVNATLCPNCSYRWILGVSSPRSWYCPKCGVSANEKTVENLCVCGHIYNEHDRSRAVENCLEAAGISGRDATPEFFAQLPAHPRPPDPPIGRCLKCHCRDYVYSLAKQTEVEG